MISNLLITTENIFNNLVNAIIQLLFFFVEFIIIAGTIAIIINIILGLPPITDKEKEFKYLSEKEKQIVIQKTKVAWVFSVFASSILSAPLFLYTKNFLFSILASVIMAILAFLWWLYTNFIRIS